MSCTLHSEGKLEMKTPPFTAEASLYKTSRRYLAGRQAINSPARTIGAIYPAQGCEYLPACPDGTTPEASLDGYCYCPTPNYCNPDLGGGCRWRQSAGSSYGYWECWCEFERGEPEPFPDLSPEPFHTPDGFCSGMVCADGSPAHESREGICHCPSMAEE